MKNICRANKSRRIFIILIVVLIFPFYLDSLLDYYIRSNIHAKIGKSEELSPFISINMDWTRQITNYSESAGIDITVDTNENIYVVAHAYNDSKQVYDILLIKYNNSGSIEWYRCWGGYDDDYGNALAVDSSGNICIVGGTSSYGNGSSDIVLIKYDNSGELIWNKIWGGILWDSAFGLTLDENDNIYVIGSTELYDSFGDISFLKYSFNGELLLNKTFGGIDSDCAYDIKCDLEGSLYFIGYTSSFGTETSNFLLIKCNYNGEQLWNISYGSIFPTIGTCLGLDSQKNLITVANTQYPGIDYNINISKINSAGQYLWNYTFSTPNYDLGYDMDFDSNENILITGHSNDDVLLLKLNQTGNKEWVKYWDGNLSDYAFGIGIDNFDNIFLTGKTKNSDYEYNLFLMKFLPVPDNFKLNSDALCPDPDGNITLQWTESIGADNYSLYRSNSPITKINGSVIELVKGTTNQSYSIQNLAEGVYYFQIFAFNEYGNTSSNCVRVKVLFPPSEFELYKITQLPNTNGIVNLTWSISIGAINYSIFIHDLPIQDINIEGFLVVEGINSTFHLVENLTNGNYYFTVVALNEAGETLSNSIYVNVRRAPISFELTTDADKPDEDGNFELIWTHSEYAQYYIVCYSNVSETEIPQDIFLYNFTPEFQWSTYRYQINGWKNGLYEFKIEANNEYGSCQSTWVEIVVSIPEDNTKEDSDNSFPIEIIQEVIFYLFFFGSLGGLAILYLRFKK